MVASLISVFSARCAQPVISATRFFLGAAAAWVCGSSIRLGEGMEDGAKATIDASFPGSAKAKGLVNFAPSMARRKRPG